MKLTTVAVLGFFAITAVACGGEDKVLWNCTCTITCDSVTSDIQSNGNCGTSGEAKDEVDKAVAECNADLAPDCTSYSCACTCNPTDTGC